MLSLRAATTLLSACDSIAAARALVGALGIGGDALPVGTALRQRLALGERCTDAAVLAGAGALRALLVDAADGVAVDGLTTHLATRLVRCAPHGLWLLVVVQRLPRMTVIAAPTTDRPGRVAGLRVDRARLVDSDAETLTALAAAGTAGGNDLLVHRRWVDLLGRESLNRRFYRDLEQRVTELASDATGTRDGQSRSEVALLCASRLLFLSFLQAKGWLDRDRAFLPRTFDACMLGGGGFHQRVLRPLFFGTLNTPPSRRAAAARAFGAIPFLNGGLFAPVAAERGRQAPRLSDATLGRLVHDLLGRYRFTAREEALTGAEAAVDPAMLGRAFESLMAHRERRASGTFYTPADIAARLTDSALVGALRRRLPPSSQDAVAALLSGAAPAVADRVAVQRAIDGMTVLDPACGSGGLLVRALERLAEWRVLSGEVRPLDTVRRELLARTIFGVDRDATAVWLCELRLWLAVAVECDEDDPRRVLPLPNLDRNIRVGDALLAPWRPGPAPAVEFPPAAHAGVAQRVRHLRDRYARASGAQKHVAARLLDRAERDAAMAQLDAELERLAARRRDIVAARRARDLFGQRVAAARLESESLRLRRDAAARRRERRQLAGGHGLPFRYDVHFADVTAQGGFAAIVGNPPWVRLHRVPPPERERLRAGFVVLRHAAWPAGAAAGGAGAGFAGQADLAALFVERSLALLRPGGVLALLVPVKLWTALAGGGVRHLLLHDAEVTRLEDLSDAPELFDAVTYPSLLVAARRPRATQQHADVPPIATPPEADVPPVVTPRAMAELAVHRGGTVAAWPARLRSLAFDASDGSAWLLLPPAARSGFDRLRDAGRPLGAGATGRPVMGVKCGYNDAFLVALDSDGAASDGGSVAIRDRHGRVGCIAASHLRPVLRGEQVRPWHAQPGDDRIVWTHDARGALRTLPPDIARWLRPHRSRLTARTDARRSDRWWALHRVEAAHHLCPRVVWADLARTPRASWLRAGDRTVPLNTCYVLRCPSDDDAAALVALLNGPLAAAWLRSIAEPARGGYRRLFAWTMALLPLPADWQRARDILAPLARRAIDSPAAPPAAAELLDAALAAYRVRRRDVEPLLEWHGAAPGR